MAEYWKLRAQSSRATVAPAGFYVKCSTSNAKLPSTLDVGRKPRNMDSGFWNLPFFQPEGVGNFPFRLYRFSVLQSRPEGGIFNGPQRGTIQSFIGA
jgi:hypothetical protein